MHSRPEPSIQCRSNPCRAKEIAIVEACEGFRGFEADDSREIAGDVEGEAKDREAAPGGEAFREVGGEAADERERAVGVGLVEEEGPEEDYGEDLVFAEAGRGPAEDVVWSLSVDVL